MSTIPWVPFNFLALPDDQSRFDLARVVVLPVPYDSTTSFRSGTRNGPKSIIEASYNLEDYDPELQVDVSSVGIHTTQALEPHMGGPALMIERVHQVVRDLTQQGKFVAVLGGEHSISIGSVAAHCSLYPNMSVLFLDAHADLRDQYMDTKWGHASVARRIHEQCPVVLVGTRSMSSEESGFIKTKRIPVNLWPPHNNMNLFSKEVISKLSPHVYISLDLDVLDPSIMAAVGTPEPGGMDWLQITSLLRKVATERTIVGFDITELSPGEGPISCAYTAAKLAYKLIAYTFLAPSR
jgi:agmatinase